MVGSIATKRRVATWRDLSACQLGATCLVQEVGRPPAKLSKGLEAQSCPGQHLGEIISRGLDFELIEQEAQHLLERDPAGGEVKPVEGVSVVNSSDMKMAVLAARDFGMPVPLKHLALTILAGPDPVDVAIGPHLPFSRVAPIVLVVEVLARG
jgi:hypothetical protein